MTHDTCTLILHRLVSCSRRKSLAKKAIQGHTGQMLSKTILIDLGIFRCGKEKSVHGRPSWELAPFDCTSQITEDFASWCKQNKGQKMDKNVKFWHSLKVKPGFLILLIILKTGATQ